MSEDELRRMVAVFKVLAHESRLRILGALATEPCSAGELTERSGLGASTVSHHLTLLREAGLVEVEKRGTSRIYRLDRDALGEVASRALVPENIAAVVPPPEPSRYQARVLRAFLDQGHLTKIPSSRKKRDVVLEWLAQRFEVDVEMSETQVNDEISQVHWDCATLRRELVGGGWMVRDAGVYRRVR